MANLFEDLEELLEIYLEKGGEAVTSIPAGAITQKNK